MYVDNCGMMAEWIFGTAAGAALADGPLPFGDVIALGVLAIGGIILLASAAPDLAPSKPHFTEIIPFRPPAPPQNNQDNSNKSPQALPQPQNRPKLPTGDAFFQIVDLRGKTWNVRGTYLRNEIVSQIMLTDAAGVYGKHTSWGVYTPHQKDAFWLAGQLAFLNRTDFFEELSVRIGEKRHYHMEGHVFFNTYDHFHIWFG